MNWFVIASMVLLAGFIGSMFFLGKKFLASPRYVRWPILAVVVGCTFVSIWMLHDEREKNEVVWATGEKAVEWPKDQLPVQVAVLPHSDINKQSISYAIDMWNKDCKLLELVDIQADHHVIIQRGSVGHKDPETGKTLAGSTYFKPSTGQFLVTIHQPGDITAEYLILAHELGRVLGLATDDYPSSIMASGVQSVKEPPYPSPTRKDRKALKERYCTP